MLLLRVSYLIGVTCLANITHSCAGAQVAYPSKAGNRVSISSDEMSSFKKAIETLHKQTGLVIIAEDAPLPTAPEPAATRKPIQNASGNEALRHVADSFDYSVDIVKNVAYLKKRFSSSQDVPCVTPEECLASLRNVQKILDQFNPRIASRRTAKENDPLITGFADSLSPDQIQALQGEGLKLQSLSPSQRSEAERFVLYIYDQTNLQDITNILSEFERLSKLKLTYREFDGKKQFGYLLPFNSGEEVFVAFNRHYSMPITSGSPPSASDAAPLDTGAQNVVTETPDSYSLKSLIDQINSASPKPEKHYTVDAALAQKRVTVAGLSKASPETVMAAVARIYGLRIVETKEAKGIISTLTSPQRRNPASISEVDSALRRILPDPLVRVIPKNFVSPAPKTPPTNVKELAAYREWVEARRDSVRQRESLPGILRQAAGAKLEQSFIDRTKSDKATDKSSVTVPFSALDEREKNTFAAALMMPALDALLRNFLKPPPNYLTRQEEVVLKGGPYVDEKGQKLFRLHYYLPKSDGKLSLQMGVNGMTYEPKQ